MVLGVLTHSFGTAKISSTQPGVVDGIRVASGQFGQKVDLLIAIRNESSLGSRESIGDVLWSELENRVATLDQQVGTTSQEYGQLGQQLDTELASLRRELILLKEQKNVVEPNYALVLDESRKIIDCHAYALYASRISLSLKK